MPPSATLLAFLAGSFLSLAILGADAQMTCRVVTNSFGAPDEYVLEGAPEGKRGKFPCMVLKNDDPPPSPKEVVYDIEMKQEVCNLEQKPLITSYLATTIEDAERYEGPWCKYECRPSSLRCLATPEKGDASCACITTGPRPAIVPLGPGEEELLTIQSASSSSPEAKFCADKQAGDPISEADFEVNCQALTLDVSRKVLLPVAEGAPVCKKQDNPKLTPGAKTTFTKFVKMEGDQGMACHYVCAKASTGYKCEDGGAGEDGECACAKTGGAGALVPQLVRKDDSAVSRMVTRDDGSKSFDATGGCFATADGGDTCGECGRCDAASGACVAAAAAGEANVCACGRVCPSAEAVASRPDGARGSPLRCAANRALGACGGDGTRAPDLCLESAESDAQDRCVCAKTHREKLGLGADAGRSTCVPLE